MAAASSDSFSCTKPPGSARAAAKGSIARFTSRTLSWFVWIVKITRSTVTRIMITLSDNQLRFLGRGAHSGNRAGIEFQVVSFDTVAEDDAPGGHQRLEAEALPRCNKPGD